MNKKNNLQIIIFGASGDLAQLKLFPAVAELFGQYQLPPSFQLIGYGRTAIAETEFRKIFQESVRRSAAKISPARLKELTADVHYFQGSYDNPNDFRSLESFCSQINHGKSSDRMVYLSVPPTVFGDIAVNSAKTLRKTSKSFRIILEKPFGTNEKSAAQLLKKLSGHYPEEEVFLLDHFLGKRPIQSILKMRLENNVINLMIRGQEIDRIEILAAETTAVGKRIGYYDQVGVIKDMVQSHLLQMLALITMDIPASLNLESLRREKQNILSAVRFSGRVQDLITGQYAGYTRLQGVARGSKTPTFAAVKLTIDRRDWFGVPVIVKTGKLLEKAVTRATVVFKKMPFQEKNAPANRLVFEMKPGESLSLKLVQRATLKDRRCKSCYEEVELSQGLGCRIDFCLGDYATLLNDVQHGDKTYFLSYPEIIAAWKIADKIEKTIRQKKVPLQIYQTNTNGPDFPTKLH